MAVTPTYNPYPALTVLVNSGSATKLLTLLMTADSTIAPRGQEITLQNDPSNTVNIRVGDSAVTTTNCGYVLTPGASRTYRNEKDNSAALGWMYVVADSGSNAKLNVEIIRA